MTRRTGRGPAALAALAAALLLGGCSGFSVPTPEPWVKPYERERLADPIMQFSRSAMAEKNFAHIREVREGSRGATGVEGGGCGCN
jgi:hypothetical protein